MSSSAITNRRPTTCTAPARARPAADLARWSAYTLMGLLIAGAATMAFRRGARALEEPLDWPALLLVGTVAAGAGAMVRLLLHTVVGRVSRPVSDGSGEPSHVRFVAAGVVSFSLVLWGIGLSLSGTRPGGLLLLWGALVGEEVWAWWNVLGLQRWFRNLRERGGTAALTPQGVKALPHGLVFGAAAGFSQDIFQQFTRSRQSDGVELLEGWMRVPLAPGQRNAAVHLAFCPPFAHPPTITVAQQEGPAAKIKEAQVLPFGARLDLKLADAADARATVLLKIEVRDDPAGGTYRQAFPLTGGTSCRTRLKTSLDFR